MDWAASAGLQKLLIKDSDGNVVQAVGVVEASGDPVVETTDIKGDDTVIARFVSGQSEDVSITIHTVPFKALKALTGNDVDSTSTSVEMFTGTDSEQNAPYVEVIAVSLAKNTAGQSGYFSKRWYKFQLTSAQLSQGLESEMTLEVTGKAFKTTKDVQGNTIDGTNEVVAKLAFTTTDVTS